MKTTNYLAQAAALPKGHPARLMALYGGRSGVVEVASRREAERLMFLFRHPFGADLDACAETNS